MSESERFDDRGDRFEGADQAGPGAASPRSRKERKERRERRERKERKERKERVLHTRIPESLEHELKRKANGLGVSVSNLVRNVLQNTFGMVNDIVADSQQIARNARQVTAAPADTPTATPAPTILGWQPLILNVNAVCDRCNQILPKGSDATVSVLASPGPSRFRCLECAKQA
jgi:hypothetical protein